MTKTEDVENPSSGTTVDELNDVSHVKRSFIVKPVEFNACFAKRLFTLMNIDTR